MTTRKRKKVLKYRGSHTHGGGAKKKRRGAGHRGGRGMAGSGKRAHHKKQLVFKLYGKDYFGKKGFHSKRKKIKAVNISFLEDNFERLLQDKIIAKKNELFEIHLDEMGCSKLLSSGKPTRKYKIFAKTFSEKAKEKIESAGGEIASN